MSIVLGNSSGSCRIKGDDRVKQSSLVAHADTSLQENLFLSLLSHVQNSMFPNLQFNLIRKSVNTQTRQVSVATSESTTIRKIGSMKLHVKLLHS